MRKLPGILLLVVGCGDNLTELPRQPYDGATASLECVPNLDGRIEASELPVVFGVPATFLVSPAGAERSVDVRGELGSDGVRHWDWSNDPADSVIAVAASPLGSKWYAGWFANGEFAAPLDATNEAVYRLDDSGLRLYGVASSEANPASGRTLLVYDSPILVYPLPLLPGAEWESTGRIRNGLYAGVPFASDDTYSGTASGAGRLALPDLTFGQAQRVSTEVMVVPAVGPTTTVYQSSFVFECFGEVARATSRINETSADFTVASAVRRLGLQP